MNGRLFALVNPTDEDHVIGWGIEITHPDDREAVVFIRDPDTRQLTFGVHESADAAWGCWACVEPMKLVWPT